MFPKRGAIALVTTALALVLLLSFKTPDPISLVADGPASSANASGVTVVPTATPGTTGRPGSTSVASTPSPALATASGTETVTGSTVSTRYGDVAVEITVTDGQITDVQAVALPTRGRSGEISDYVAPILAGEALQAQSASIDIISGATYTSRAYAESLQSALDQAGIATVAIVG